MAKASILRQLADEDLEAVCHLIRRDAMSDLEIAKEVERLLGREIGPTDAARGMVISRYRQSAEYRKWFDHWLNQDAVLKRQLEGQKQRFELVSSLVKGTGNDGLNAVSKSLLARLLAMAAEMSDEDLQEAASGKGSWVARVIKAQHEIAKAEHRNNQSPAPGQNTGEQVDPGERTKAVVDKVDKIMGLK